MDFPVDNKKQQDNVSYEWTPINWKNRYELYMLFIAVFGKAFVLVQSAKILETKNSENVSFLAYIIYLIVNISWFFFGLKKKEFVIIISSLTGIVVAGIILTVIIKYKENKYNLW